MLYNNNLKRGFKLFLAILISFLLVKSVFNRIFLSGTPRINPFFIAGLKKLPLEIKNSSQKVIASLLNKIKGSSKTAQLEPIIKNIADIPLNQFNKTAEGVYAYEDKENNVVYIKFDDNLQFEERTINYKGELIKVKFPKGSFSN